MLDEVLVAVDEHGGYLMGKRHCLPFIKHDKKCYKNTLEEEIIAVTVIHWAGAIEMRSIRTLRTDNNRSYKNRMVYWYIHDKQ